jgi:hypothetical protein
VWTSVVLFLGGVLYLVISARRRPGRETDVRRDTPAPEVIDDQHDDQQGADHGTTPEAADVPPAGAQQDAEHGSERGT